MNLSLKSMAWIKTSAMATALLLSVRIASAQVTSGTGTAGKIPVWTGPHSQGNSVITQSGTRIGIGTTAPTGLLAVTSATAAPAIIANDTSTGPAIWGIANSGYGVRGNSNTGVGLAGYSGTFVGLIGNGPTIGVWGAGAGIGVYGASTSDGDGVSGSSLNGDGVYGASTHNYGGNFFSANYRSGYFQTNASAFFTVVVDFPGPVGSTCFDVKAGLEVDGNLVVAGSKSGYVVDHMQNADSVALEAGDVVVIAEDSGAPVLGKIPAPRIKLAAAANDTAVVGVVDQVTYVPDDATRSAYEAQEKADHEAAAQARAVSGDPANERSPMANIQNRITDEAGTLHADLNATSAAPGRYCSVVTLGAYEAVKVDASFGPIKAGDLLTTSPHAGYAMKVTDRVAASGAIIGKALSSLGGGVGTVSILVTLK